MKIDEKAIDGMIRRAVAAMKVASERSAKDAYRATERRLYALPDIRAKLEDDRETLAEVLAELRRIEAGSDVRPELTDTIRMIAVIMDGLKDGRRP